jgi:hypothetical protein
LPRLPGYRSAGGRFRAGQKPHQSFDIGGREITEYFGDPALMRARHSAEHAAAFGRETDDLCSAVAAGLPTIKQAECDQPLGKTGDVPVRNHHALRQFPQRHTTGRFVELRHQIESRQSHVKFLAKPPANLAFYQRRAGQEPQPEAQLAFVVAWAFRDLGFSV